MHCGIISAGKGNEFYYLVFENHFTIQLRGCCSYHLFLKNYFPFNEMFPLFWGSDEHQFYPYSEEGTHASLKIALWNFWK